MQQTADKKPHKRAAGKPKMPRILRFILGVCFAAWILAKYIWHLAGKNPLLTLGIILFAALFAIVAYNAFFRQNIVSRPVLFATRAGGNAAAPPSGARPFTEKTLSAQGAAGDKGKAAMLPSKAPNGNDAVAALIAAQGISAPRGGQNNAKRSGAEQGTAANHFIPLPQQPPRAAERSETRRRSEAAAERASASETRRGKETAAERSETRRRSEAAAGKARAAPDRAGKSPARADRRQNRSIAGKERIIRAQKALQKVGDRNLAANGIWDSRTRAAARRFQKAHGLKPSGEIDKALIEALQKRHLW